jgi:hypothetical protein
LQVICLPANFLNYAANFIDKYAKRSTKAVFGESEVYKQINTLLQKYRYKVRQNPAWDTDYDLSCVMNHCSNKAMLQTLIDHDFTNIEQIVEDNNKLFNYDLFKEIINGEDKKAYNQIKRNFKNDNNNSIKDFISTRLNLNMREDTFDPNDFFFDEEYQGYEVYIDETLKKTKK